MLKEVFGFDPSLIVSRARALFGEDHPEHCTLGETSYKYLQLVF